MSLTHLKRPRLNRPPLRILSCVKASISVCSAFFTSSEMLVARDLSAPAAGSRCDRPRSNSATIRKPEHGL